MAYTKQEKKEYAQQKKMQHRDAWLTTIEDGIMNDDVPWRKPWKATGHGGLPSNIQSKRFYRGSNIITLMFNAMANGYSDMRWGTRKQLLAKGLSIKGLKSGTGCYITFAKTQRYKTENEKGDEEYQQYFITRWYEVWNVEQCEDYEAPTVDVDDVIPVSELMANFQTYADSQNDLTIQRAGVRAFYNKDMDSITLPPHEAFHDPHGEVVTAFHEAAHSTGHKSRIGRPLGNGFGTPAYAYEELIAELSSMFVVLQLGGNYDPALIQEEHTNNLAYLRGWLSRCEDKQKALSNAFYEAQRAADYILATMEGDEE